MLRKLPAQGWLEGALAGVHITGTKCGRCLNQGNIVKGGGFPDDNKKSI
ncbi:MAG: hypothetical protein JW832_08395 [Deltaproteobacteria bacterium]|nr:hypothetical protein [Deltaproteobacteria bacterium]